MFMNIYQLVKTRISQGRHEAYIYWGFSQILLKIQMNVRSGVLMQNVSGESITVFNGKIKMLY